MIKDYLFKVIFIEYTRNYINCAVLKQSEMLQLYAKYAF